MGKKLYTQDASGIRFVSDRQPGEVRIPNYVYDLWLPLLGATYIGVYGMYCRLERQEDVKGTSNQKIAKVCRIGTSKLGEINKALEELGFIKTTKPNGAEKLKHFTTIITVCDPPKEVTPEIVAKYGNAESYEPLSTWLIEDTTKSQTGIRYSHSQFPNGNADNPKQERGDTQMGTPLLQPSSLQPLEIESKTLAPSAGDPFNEFVETMDIPELPPVPEVPPDDAQPALTEHQAIVAIVDAYLKHTGVIDPKMYKKTTIRDSAAVMHKRGIGAEDVKQYLEHMAKDAFWGDKVIKWGKLCDEITGFVNKRSKPAPSNNPAHQRVIIPDEPAGDPEQLAMIQAMMRQTADKLLVSDRAKNGR
jgi:hypothetical protein